MAIATSDDYAIITHGRVIDKAIILAYDGLLRFLDGPIYTNADGHIVPETVQLLTRAAYDEINNNMVIGRTGNEVEVVTEGGSLPLTAVFIDPVQPVLTIEEVDVQISIQPVGAAKVITVNIGLSVPQ